MKPILHSRRVVAVAAFTLLAGSSPFASAQEHGAAARGGSPAKPAAASAGHDALAAKPAAALTPKAIGEQVRAAVAAGIDPKNPKTMTVEVAKEPQPGSARRSVTALRSGEVVRSAPIHVPQGAIPNPMASREYLRARAAALSGVHALPAPTLVMGAGAHGAAEVHWDYTGVAGPQAWGQLKPEYALCATGKRQSPINIEDSGTLRGPAEPILFQYAPSDASVVNNGHTIQVDVSGNNAITVRGTRFDLLQFQFHHPSEERINFQAFDMVAHLVHRNAMGQLAVVAVLLQQGPANPVINTVWTYMPLGANDRVKMPAGALDLGGLLPKDARYYQFLGSLTTPPCSEEVLWMVLKQPVTISPEQFRLFAQQFPNNARPVQPLNGRVVRSAQ